VLGPQKYQPPIITQNEITKTFAALFALLFLLVCSGESTAITIIVIILERIREISQIGMLTV
jgi:hypothetical protein